MANFVNIQVSVLGKDVEVCIANGSLKTSQLVCDILGFKANCYSCLKKDSFWAGYNYLSIEAITICTYLNYDLSSLEKVLNAVSHREEIVAEWNKINSICDGNWENMCSYMRGDFTDENLENTQTNNPTSKSYENLKSGDIAFEGTTRKIIYHEDTLSLEAIVRSGGLVGMLDDSARIPNESIYIEDIRGITIYEGKGASNVLLTSMFGGNRNAAVMESISYIKFEIKGVNDVRTFSPASHPYTITIRADQISEANNLKNFLDAKIKNFRKNQNKSQVSSADELIKYSELLEKGLISKDEFDELKKKLLGL